MDNLGIELLSGAVGGAVVSSLIGPFFNRYQDRRRIKADVLKALLAVEVSRWASKDQTYYRYISDVHQLRAAALVARAYRPLVEFYVRASAIARTGSDDDFEANKGSEYAGRIDTEIADFVSDTAEALTDYLWHPYVSRISVLSRLATLEKQYVTLRRKYTSKRSRSRHIYDWEWKG